MANVCPKLSDVQVGAEAAAQQTESMQLLQPLAVDDVGFPTRHVLDVTRIDDDDREAAFTENVEQRYPIDSRRFDRDGVDCALDEPISKLVQIGCERPKDFDRIIITVCGYGHVVLFRSTVDTGSIGIYGLELGTGFFANFALFGFVGHHGLLHN